VPSPGKALLIGDASAYSVDDMLGRVDVPGGASDDLVNDYVWGASIYPAPVTLDFTWLVQPLAWRPVPPINSMSVSRAGAATAYAQNPASRDEYGTFDPGAVTVQTNIEADPLALATFVTTYQATFRQRPPVLTFDLLERTQGEQWTILSVGEGTRIIIANTPSTWPVECLSLFVDGVSHEISLDVRKVRFTCSPLVGQSAGRNGPWFTADRSMTGDSDVSPF
jgi:hypothetical protein